MSESLLVYDDMGTEVILNGKKTLRFEELSYSYTASYDEVYNLKGEFCGCILQKEERKINMKLSFEEFILLEKKIVKNEISLTISFYKGKEKIVDFLKCFFQAVVFDRENGIPYASISGILTAPIERNSEKMRAGKILFFQDDPFNLVVDGKRLPGVLRKLSPRNSFIQNTETVQDSNIPYRRINGYSETSFKVEILFYDTPKKTADEIAQDFWDTYYDRDGNKPKLHQIEHPYFFENEYFIFGLAMDLQTNKVVASFDISEYVPLSRNKSRSKLHASKFESQEQIFIDRDEIELTKEEENLILEVFDGSKIF